MIFASYIDDRYVEEHVDRASEEAWYLATEEEITREERCFSKGSISWKKENIRGSVEAA